jgi:uncharacterized protein (TIGR03083 family)
MTFATDVQLWRHASLARAALADDLADLDEEQWRVRSLCTEWDVEQVVAHLTAAASLGRFRWLRSIVGAGLRPAVHNDRRLREHLGATPAETLDRFRAVIDSTTAPSADTAAYLGEVIVHGQDIRRPLGIDAEADPESLTHVARFFAQRDFTVPSKSMVRGLRLRATDGAFDHGAGATIAGPTLALVMAMAGRSAYLDQLDGPGREIIRQRLESAATTR